MKHICFLVFCMFFTLHAWCQEVELQDKITLKTGDSYTGEIIVKTNDIIMLKTKDGSRFQFQITEISKIEKVARDEVSTIENSQPSEVKSQTFNFVGIVELSGGISTSNNAFESSANTQVSLLFGKKSILENQLFVGAGIGYNNIFIATNSESVQFLPLFLRIQNTFSNNRTSPYVGIDAGYSFALNEGYGGGLFAKLSVGISYKINYKTLLSFGIYGGINSIAANLVETNELGTFRYYGNSSMTNYGLKMGLQF